MSEKKKILVVDDDQNVLETVSRFLSMNGYSVDTAQTGKEAIAKSRDHFYNLVVLDIRLPDMDGTELLTAMRDTEPKMVKIMFTGYPGYQNAVESLNKGADAYVTKPVELDELLKVIKEKLKEQDQALEMDQKKVVKYIESRDKQLNET